MKALTVRYEPSTDAQFTKQADRIVVREINLRELVRIRGLVDTGAVNEIILVGQNVCIGWGFVTSRKVIRVEGAHANPMHKVEEMQALNRIRSQVIG